MSIPEAGRRIGICRGSIYALLRRGELKSIKAGGRRLIPEAEISRFIERKLAESEAA